MSYNLRMVLLLLGLCLLFGLLTDNPIFYRLAYVFLLLLATSWVMAQLALRRIQFSRNTRTERSQVGQLFEERFDLRNASRIPRLWIEVRDDTTLPEGRGSHVMTLIGANESRTFLARTRLLQRGVFPLGPTTLISGDLFGLFQVSREIAPTESLLVYPHLVEITSFPNPPGLLPGGEALRRRTMQITSNASGVREYLPGDPLNRIHWISTARRDRLMVKEFELDPLAEVWLFVDAEAVMHTTRPYQQPTFDLGDVWRRRYRFELPPSTEEYAVTAAASLARYYLQRDRSVGLAYASQSLHLLPADRGGRQLGKILEALALLKADGSLPLPALLEAQARHLPRGSTLVIITPNTTDAVLKTVDMLLRRGLRPVMISIDAATFGGTSKADFLIASLRSLGVPACRVVEGDNLGQALSAATSILM